MNTFDPTNEVQPIEIIEEETLNTCTSVLEGQEMELVPLETVNEAHMDDQEASVTIETDIPTEVISAVSTSPVEIAKESPSQTLGYPLPSVGPSLSKIFSNPVALIGQKRARKQIKK